MKRRDYKNEAFDVLKSMEFTCVDLAYQIFKERPSAIVHAAETIQKKNPTDFDKGIIDLIENSKGLIPAIKHYRNVKNTDLKEAKNAVKAIRDKYTIN